MTIETLTQPETKTIYRVYRFCETMLEWKNFWILPSIMAAAVFVLFLLLFHDRATSNDATDGSEISEPENGAANQAT